MENQQKPYARDAGPSLAEQASGARPNPPDARSGQAHTQDQQHTDAGQPETSGVENHRAAEQAGTMSEEARNQLATGQKSSAESGTP